MFKKSTKSGKIDRQISSSPKSGEVVKAFLPNLFQVGRSAFATDNVSFISSVTMQEKKLDLHEENQHPIKDCQ